MKVLISTFFLLFVLMGCQQGVLPLEPSTPQPILQDVSEARKGQKAALEDIERGELSLITYGRPSPSFVKYAEILQQRYNVKAGGGCIQRATEAYVEAYNRMMKAKIAERFGADALEEAWAEATG